MSINTMLPSSRKMANHLKILSIIICLIVLFATLVPQQTESYYLKKRQIKALKKVAVAASVLGNRKKIMIPLPVPLPLPIPIISKHEPIIAPIDPFLSIVAAKGAKGYYPYGGVGGLGKR